MGGLILTGLHHTGDPSPWSLSRSKVQNSSTVRWAFQTCIPFRRCSDEPRLGFVDHSTRSGTPGLRSPHTISCTSLMCWRFGTSKLIQRSVRGRNRDRREQREGFGFSTESDRSVRVVSYSSLEGKPLVTFSHRTYRAELLYPIRYGSSRSHPWILCRQQSMMVDTRIL